MLYSGVLQQILDSAEKVAPRMEHPSLFVQSVSDNEKRFENIDARDQCYKTFYGRELPLFIII